MGHIPENAEWYLAELLMEITVQGARSNVVHRNLFLVNANSPEKAYDKAVLIGQSEETEYINPKDQAVEIRFRGIAGLDVVYEPLIDGAELSFVEQLGVSESDIQRMIPARHELHVFTPPNPGKERDPDYSSKAVMEEAVECLTKIKSKLGAPAHKLGGRTQGLLCGDRAGKLPSGLRKIAYRIEAP